MDSELRGCEEILENLDQLTEEARKLLENRALPIYELFTTKFMHEYTEYPNLQVMLDDSGFSIHSPEDLDAIPDDQWDAFICESTSFSDWCEMLETAVCEWVETQIGQ